LACGSGQPLTCVCSCFVTAGDMLFVVRAGVFRAESRVRLVLSFVTFGISCIPGEPMEATSPMKGNVLKNRWRQYLPLEFGALQDMTHVPFCGDDVVF